MKPRGPAVTHLAPAPAPERPGSGDLRQIHGLAVQPSREVLRRQIAALTRKLRLRVRLGGLAQEPRERGDILRRMSCLSQHFITLGGPSQVPRQRGDPARALLFRARREEERPADNLAAARGRLVGRRGRETPGSRGR